MAEALAKPGFALNAYHIASGGNGLIIGDIQVRVPDPEFAGGNITHARAPASLEWLGCQLAMLDETV